VKFRTKQFEIEAVQFTGKNPEEVSEFTNGKFHLVFPVTDETDEIVAVVFDKLHDTNVGVKAGQWIIRGMKGEYYPCDPEVFEAKYEPAD